MRIASNQYHATMNSALQTANTGLSLVMQQMAAGNRVLKPSDDTIATVRLARLAREQAALDQYQENIGALKTRLQTSEVTLASMEQDFMMMRDLLVWAGDGANTGDDLAAMASSLMALRDSLFFSANAKNAEGRYLFSGTASDQPTVDAGYAWQGNNSTQKVAVGDQVTLDANVSLPEVAPFLTQVNTLIAVLQTPGVTATTARPDIETTLNQLDDTFGAVSSKIAELGRRQNVLQTQSDNHGSVSISNKQAALDLGQLDYAEASVRLNSFTLAVQATQKAYAKVSNLSLFNVF
jgi:flagellar hook-associated protein 3 FlgL